MNEKKSLLIVDDDIAHRTMLRILLDMDTFYPGKLVQKPKKREIFLHLHKGQAESKVSNQVL